MPPSTPASGGRLRRASLLLALVLIAPGVYGFVQLGSFLAKEDELQKADAILVLSGTPMRRPLEAADLYLREVVPEVPKLIAYFFGLGA